MYNSHYFVGPLIQILIDEECNNIDLRGKYGLIKTIVIPPKDLQIPILPFNICR